MVKKPMIGVIPLFDEEKESYWMLPGYMKAVEEAGGIPVMLPLTADEETVLRLAESFDGFLFTGGHDINPEMYGEKIEEICGDLCEERDLMEAALFKEVIRLDKPALGICRGMQLFNVLLGGTLYQDIPAQLTASRLSHRQQHPYTAAVHRVSVKKDTLLYDVLQKDSLGVNSLHHQGIKGISEQLMPVAAAEDGLVEAVVMPDKKFVLAVQWHPEFSYRLDDDSFKLFSAFVDHAYKQAAAEAEYTTR